MEFPLPPIGEGVYEVELVRWLVRPGDIVTRGQPLLEVLSDKATMEVPAPFAGTITDTRWEPGARLKVGQVVLSYTPAEKATGTTVSRESSPPGPESLEPLSRAAESPKNGHKAVAAAPSVRLLARRLGIDLTTVTGTGPGGRVLHSDLAPYITRPEPPPPLPGPTAPHSPSSETRTKLIGIRQRIAANMVASKQHIPHYSYVDECDVTDLVRLRDQLKEPLQNQGVKLTYLPFIIKAVARALGEMPALNSTFDDTTQEIITHPTVNIGVAVAAPAGLMVPVLKRADQKDIVTIAKDIDRLATDARNGRIKPDDIQGGTFTVTSIGGIGGLISTPIIHRPQVAILGIGKIVKRPVYDDAGQLRPAEMLYLSFSFDHRIIDGAIGAQFGNAVIRQLSQPAALLLG